MGEITSFLKLLKKSKPTYRKILLERAPNEVIQLLGNCAQNILSGKTIITKAQKAKIRPHRKALHLLARGSVKHKKKILQRGGGIFSSLFDFGAEALAKKLVTTVTGGNEYRM